MRSEGSQLLALYENVACLMSVVKKAWVITAMTSYRFVHIALPVAFFAAAIGAWLQMQDAIATNIATGLGNQLRQLLFQAPLPSHPHIADAWFWTSAGCFVYGVILLCRLFRSDKTRVR
jgi:hypothetical protein